MGRPLKMSETVGGVAKSGVIGDTARAGAQIEVEAYIPEADGGTEPLAGYIARQVGSRSFRCTTDEGTGKCRLVTGTPGAGEMRITATDSDGDTYYVTKISARVVTLEPDTGTQFASGARVAWNLDTAEEGVSVVLASA